MGAMTSYCICEENQHGCDEAKSLTRFAALNREFGELFMGSKFKIESDGHGLLG